MRLFELLTIREEDWSDYSLIEVKDSFVVLLDLYYVDIDDPDEEKDILFETTDYHCIAVRHGDVETRHIASTRKDFYPVLEFIKNFKVMESMY